MIQKAPPHLTPAVCPPGKTFLFYYETLWALPSLLECFSNATQDVVGISSFMIILCPSVIEGISVTAQATDFLSSGEQHLGNFWSEIPVVTAGRCSRLAVSSWCRVRVADTLKVMSKSVPFHLSAMGELPPSANSDIPALMQDPTWIQLSFGQSYRWGFPAGLVAKNPPAKQGMYVQSLGWEDPVEKGTATHSSILALEIPWTEDPGGLQSMGLHSVVHDQSDFKKPAVSPQKPSAFPAGHWASFNHSANTLVPAPQLELQW